MFGTWRFLMAVFVVYAHNGGFLLPGMHGLFAFYVLSGYLMVLVANERYGFTPRGIGAFALNRFLRIYPPYWAACLLTVACFAALGETAATQYWSPWRWPSGALEWLDNVVILSLPGGADNRLVPPAWSLRVEIFYYIAIGLGLGRGPRTTALWLVAGLGWHVYTTVTGLGMRDWYFSVPAAGLPFAVGALVYHTQHRLPQAIRDSKPLLAAAFLAWLGNIFYPIVLPAAHYLVHFYGGLVLSSVLVALLGRRPVESRRLRRIDQRLGDLTYPIYVTHMQVGFVFAGLTTLTLGAELFALSLVPVIAVGWASLWLVDDRVNAIRDRVKAPFLRRAAATAGAGVATPIADGSHHEEGRR